jgi:hypothetical protein
MAGYFANGNFCPDSERFLLFPDDEQEIWRHLRLLQFLGIASAGPELEFPFTRRMRRLCRFTTSPMSAFTPVLAIRHVAGRPSTLPASPTAYMSRDTGSC